MSLVALQIALPAQAEEQNRFEKETVDASPVTYEGKYLTGLDFPIGALGGSVIRMNGKAVREWWQIFNNFEERKGSSKLPNTFFAVRTAPAAGDGVTVRALQTSAVGPFTPMRSLSFQGEYPFGRFTFADDALPIQVMLEAYNPLIPMDMKNSAIPCAIFRVGISNPTEHAVDVSLLASQQNAVGFTGYETIGGENSRHCAGYGANRNRVAADAGRTGVAMTGPDGSMHLSVDNADATATAAWTDLSALLVDFVDDGKLSGPETAESPAPATTVDAALAAAARLQPGEEKTVTFVLSWYFPGGTFGRKDIARWYFENAGSQYENWWPDAADVDRYVAENFDYLDATTRLYRDTMYASNLPRYALDRITSNICVLKSPTVFWTKAGYFGIWESTSNDEKWCGNCKHVIHYAQAHARLFPELGRTLREIDLDSQLDSGLLPDRDGGDKNALDGHFGSILGVYREHLTSENNDFLTDAWPRTRKALDFAISTFDDDRDGLLQGTYHNTLDCNSSGTSPWIGSLYMAALKAGEKMADVVGDADAAARYRTLWRTGIRNQNEQLWSEEHGYYVERPQNLPETRIMGDAVSLDMFLGQWWANQLGLGQLYPVDRTRAGLATIYATNKVTDPGHGYPPAFRDFLGTGDTGWMMFTHQDGVPENTILYYCEVMSGFEYAAAATMLQYGMIEGLSMVQSISERYDGRLRAADEVTTASNATVFGTGSPFGEDECGDFYARPMSSWSVLLALQGFILNGPERTIGFKPVWQPADHTSFFAGQRGWGLFRQRRDAGSQTAMLELKYGTLDVKHLILELPEDCAPETVAVRVDGSEVKTAAATQGRELRITLPQAIVLRPGQTLVVETAPSSNK